MSKSSIDVEVSVSITGDASEALAKQLSRDIISAIQAVVNKAKETSSVSVEQEDKEMDAPLFADRKANLLRFLEESAVPEEAIAAIKRGDSVMDRYGAINGCTCRFCQVLRNENDDLPGIIYMLESVARENQCDLMEGVYILRESAIKEYVPERHIPTVMRYFTLNPHWDRDGTTMYYKPVPETAGKE